MKAMVRDDIIALETFVALRFKYEKYIEMIYDCGGYCFVDQLVRYFGGENKGRYLAEQLEENGLIKTKFFNNYKYCYLTDASIKYVKYKDDPRDFSKMKKANIPVKKINPNPTDKVLFSSALKFDLIQTSKVLGKRAFIDNCKKVFSVLYNKEQKKDELIKTAIEKTINYYDKAKVIFFSNPDDISLRMIILDTGTKKSGKNYIDLLNKYLQDINIEFKQIFITPFTYSEKEFDAIFKELSKKYYERENLIKNLKERYDITPTKIPDRPLSESDRVMYQQIESKRQLNVLAFNGELKQINKLIPPFKIGKLRLPVYMEHYKDRIALNTNYIKSKDIDRFEALREKFKNKE